MPRLSSQGNVACGIAGVQGSLNGSYIPNSYGGYWYNDNTLIFIDPNGVQLTWYDVVSGARGPTANHSANVLYANGGVWAAWIDPVQGLKSSNGVNLPLAGLLDVGPDGSIGYTVDRQTDNKGCDAVNVNGEVWRLSEGPILNLQLLGSNRAIFQDYGFNLVSVGVPQITRITGNFWNPSAVFVNNEWWISYFSESKGLVLHPFNSTVGYQITGVPCFHNTSIAFGNQIRLAWSITDGEGANDFRLIDQNLSLPRVQLSETVTIPPINKPCWVTWFEFNKPPVNYPPGNAVIKIRYEDANSIVSKEGVKFAIWTEGASVEEIERKSRETAEACLCYWDSRNWPRWPVIKTNDWLGLQAYCNVAESPAQFEGSMRSLITSVPSQYNQIALICQCYTSNAGLTTNLTGLVPVFAKLARDYPRVNMLAVFSDQDRATGLNDHPEVRPLWQELFNSVTGEPNMSSDPEIIPSYICDAAEEFRKEFPTPMGQRGAELLNKVAWKYREDGWGLEVKEGGNVCTQPHTGQTCSCDVIRLPNSGYDILVDAEGACTINRDAHRGNVTPDKPLVPPVETGDPTPPPTGDIFIAIYEYDRVVQRSNPNGMLIRFEVGSLNPIVEITLGLVETGEVIPISFTTQPAKDGRYVRALAFKPTINGKWTLRVTGKDSTGKTGSLDGVDKVEVTF